MAFLNLATDADLGSGPGRHRRATAAAPWSGQVAGL